MERLLSIMDVARRYPGKNGCEHLHPMTIRNWYSRGVRGIILKTVQRGGRVFVRESDLMEFENALDRTRTVGQRLGRKCREAEAAAERLRAKLTRGTD